MTTMIARTRLRHSVRKTSRTPIPRDGGPESTVRFTCHGPTTLAWRQEKGELKPAGGRWELEDLGGHRTRAAYWLEADLGRVLSLVIRGPLVDLLRGMLVDARAGELKQAIESG